MPQIDLTKEEVGDILTCINLVGVQGSDNIERVAGLIQKLKPHASPKKEAPHTK